jgi:hypothetical protein
MGMKINIENVQNIGKGIWKSNLYPSEVEVFGTCVNIYGETSVLLLLESVDFKASTGVLSFDPKIAHLINKGSSENLIIISDSSNRSAKATNSRQPTLKPNANIRTSGDKLFIEKLPPHIKELGAIFLSEVRKHFSGELKFYERSGKYVEGPDNFWTVRPQPKDKSLRITIRGIPDLFREHTTLDIKSDMSGYSAFKIKTLAQISDAMSVLRMAAKYNKS